MSEITRKEIRDTVSELREYRKELEERAEEESDAIHASHLYGRAQGVRAGIASLEEKFEFHSFDYDTEADNDV